MQANPEQPKGLAGQLLLAVFFAGAYGQAPLYSSNQNTYFVRGVALAEGGPLTDDWLVNCADHIPVFTALVYAVVRWMSPGVFYFIHGALIALYAFCLLWLIGRVFRLGGKSPVLALSMVLLAVVHARLVAHSLRSAGFDPLSKLASFFANATQGVAGQPLLRHFHQPSAFGVLLLASICLFVAGKPRLAAVTAAVSAWLHPTYLLAAGLLTLIYMLIEWRGGRRVHSLQLGLLALAAVSPSLVYTWHEFLGKAPAAVVVRAQEILVHKRFPHHADPHVWFGNSTILQVILTLVGIVISRRNLHLFIILTTLFVIACTLTLVQALTGIDALALLLPWRLFVLLVPISTALLVGRLVSAPLSRWKGASRYAKELRAAAYVLMGVLFVAGVSSTKLRLDRAKHPGRLVSFVSGNCEPGTNFLVPPRWSRFRLQTRCPIFVDWKSHPYRHDEVVEWYERNQLVRAFYRARGENDRVGSLEQLRERAAITHVVVRRQAALPFDYPDAHLVFDDGAHLVYEIADD